MAQERRSAPRALLSGALVTYENAAGDRVEADMRDLAPGGLFVQTPKALVVGKRLALDLQVRREQAPWSAVGRVVWVRERNESADRPQGMGVKLIDADDAMVDAIERMVERAAGAGEQTEPGLGNAPPSPVLQRATLPVGGAPVEAEPSLTIDLVTREAKWQARVVDAPSDVAEAPLSEPEPDNAARRRGAGRWVVTLLVLAIAGVAAYAYLHGTFDRLR